MAYASYACNSASFQIRFLHFINHWVESLHAVNYVMWRNLLNACIFHSYAKGIWLRFSILNCQKSQNDTSEGRLSEFVLITSAGVSFFFIYMKFLMVAEFYDKENKLYPKVIFPSWWTIKQVKNWALWTIILCGLKHG